MAALIFDQYQVLTLEESSGVIGILTSFQPDIILLDIMLGDTDGSLLCRKLKSNPAFSHIPIVLMTAAFIKERDKECGADGFIEKPFDLGAVNALIELITKGG